MTVLFIERFKLKKISIIKMYFSLMILFRTWYIVTAHLVMT